MTKQAVIAIMEFAYETDSKYQRILADKIEEANALDYSSVSELIDEVKQQMLDEELQD